jgi:hypothetical protein
MNVLSALQKALPKAGQISEQYAFKTLYHYT